MTVLASSGLTVHSRSTIASHAASSLPAAATARMNSDGTMVAPPTARNRSVASGRSMSHSRAVRRRLRNSRNGSPAAGTSLHTRISAVTLARESAPLGGNSISCGMAAPSYPADDVVEVVGVPPVAAPLPAQLVEARGDRSGPDDHPRAD